MTINDQIRDENYNMILIEKQPKYQLYHLVKFINMNIWLVPSNQQQIIEQAKFTYSPLGKAFEKQIKAIEDQRKKTGWCFRKFETKRRNKTKWG